jgi:hypothetical protein
VGRMWLLYQRAGFVGNEPRRPESRIPGTDEAVHNIAMTATSPSAHELRAETLAEEKRQLAQGPGGAERLSADIERSTARLRALVDKLQGGGGTFPPEELIGIQAEIDDATLQIEVATTVLAGAVSDVKSRLSGGDT